MNKNRFDLEQAITNLYSTVDDLRVVADTIYDSNKNYTEDSIHTTLTGLAEVLDAKIVVLEDIFCQVHELNEYAVDSEVMEARQRFEDALSEMEMNKPFDDMRTEEQGSNYP
jgi:hypothetical protein